MKWIIACHQGMVQTTKICKTYMMCRHKSTKSNHTCGHSVACTVLHGAEHAWLVVVVVRVEKVAVGAVFLALSVPKDLDLLSQLIRQSRQVVSTLFDASARGVQMPR